LGHVLLSLERPAVLAAVRDELLKTHSGLTMSGLEAAQKYNFQRYHYQGIGRYDVYKRGLADLQVLASVIGDNKFLFGFGNGRGCLEQAGATAGSPACKIALRNRDGS
jgi:hypothetical protein